MLTYELTSSSAYEGMVSTVVDSSGRYDERTLTTCDCCPDHQFWRKAGETRICHECFNSEMPTITGRDAEMAERLIRRIRSAKDSLRRLGLDPERHT